MFSQFGPVVKNILLLNIALFILTWVLELKGIDLGRYLGLYNLGSPYFKPYQLISHMFMHGSIMHIFFNMYAVIIFGPVLERIWGAKRFFIFYFACGIAAGLFSLGIDYFEYVNLKSQMSSTQLNQIYNNVLNTTDINTLTYQGDIELKVLLNYLIPMVGASGAVFGILAAFAWLFPNTELQLIFPPIPVKAKWLIGIYALIEIYLGFSGKQTGVAHWAHIGGAIMGTIFIFVWKQNKNKFY